MDCSRFFWFQSLHCEISCYCDLFSFMCDSQFFICIFQCTIFSCILSVLIIICHGDFLFWYCLFCVLCSSCIWMEGYFLSLGNLVITWDSYPSPMAVIERYCFILFCFLLSCFSQCFTLSLLHCTYFLI